MSHLDLDDYATDDPPLQLLSPTSHDDRYPSVVMDPYSTHPHGRGDSLFTLMNAPPGAHLPAGVIAPPNFWADQPNWVVGDLVGPDGTWSVKEGYGRPDYSWWSIIRATILGNPGQRAMLNDICDQISMRYPYFRSDPEIWKVTKAAIRHNLSVKTCFVWSSQASTKGGYWSVDLSIDPAAGRKRQRPKEENPEEESNKRPPGRPRKQVSDGTITKEDLQAEARRQKAREKRQREREAERALRVQENQSGGAGMDRIVVEPSASDAELLQQIGAAFNGTSNLPPPPPTQSSTSVDGKPVRPAHSFPELLAIILTSSPDGRASISHIFQGIVERWPFFATENAPKSWKNTCRNVLSTHRCFRKIPRGSNETGKGDYWCLVPGTDQNGLNKSNLNVGISNENDKLHLGDHLDGNLQDEQIGGGGGGGGVEDTSTDVPVRTDTDEGERVRLALQAVARVPPSAMRDDALEWMSEQDDIVIDPSLADPSLVENT